jgi:hypothetical protein
MIRIKKIGIALLLNIGFFMILTGIYFSNSNAAQPNQTPPNTTDNQNPINNDQVPKDINSLPKPNDPQAKSQVYITNPEPIYKANKEKLEELQSKKEEYVKKITLKDNEELKSVELMTWGEYNKSMGEAKNFEVSDDRVIWKITVYHPGDLITKAGTFRNASIIYAIDAETSKVFERSITGDLDPDTTNPGLRYGR